MRIGAVSKKNLEPLEEAGTKDRGLTPVAPMPGFDTRWLWGIVIVVPIVLTTGVYWLHQLPSGPNARAGGTIVEVRLVQDLVHDPVLVAARPDEATSKGRPEPMIEAPNRPIPEETTTIASAPATVTPGPSVERSTSVTTSRPQPVATGSASAFQRTLLSHIARFRRYPQSARSGEHGVAQVVFAMRRDGTVSEIWVRTSSGHLTLDEAATETVRRAQPLPTIPRELPDRLTILLPISFDPP